MKTKTHSRTIAIILAMVSILTSAMPAFAADATPSSGSQGSDIAILDDSNYDVAGKDTKQNKSSEYELYTLDGDDVISEVNVYATVVDGGDVYDPENPEADENGFVNGEIQVGVPTTIILDGTPDSEGYYVGKASGKVKGNISGATIINVVPDSEVTLSTEGKNDVTAPITQDYTQFVVPTSEFGGAKVNKHVTPSFNDKAVFDVSVKTKDLSAGSWAGSFNYNISVTNTATSPLGNRIKSWKVSGSADDDVWMTYYQPEGESASATDIENPDGSSTSISKYENGTVVIRGIGEMADSIGSNFYDIEAMNKFANDKYWSTIHDYLTDEEFDALTNAVDEGTRLFEYYSSSSIDSTDAFKSMSLELQKIARKGLFGIDPLERLQFRLFVPKAVIIEDGVTNVSPSAFASCYEIESVLLPETVTVIGDAAFSNCPYLTSINIPAGVTSFGSFALSGCRRLTSITLGENVTEVKQQAFSNMTATIHCPTQAIADMVTSTSVISTALYNPTVVVDAR
jgi:hypothetical protein